MGRAHDESDLRCERPMKVNIDWPENFNILHITCTLRCMRISPYLLPKFSYMDRSSCVLLMEDSESTLIRAGFDWLKLGFCVHD